LIVDDSVIVRMDLATAFEAAGVHPIPCQTLSEARVKMAAERPCAVILDVVLADGDGVSFLGELRASDATEGTIVLMLSTEAEVKDRLRGPRAGANEYVGKPYDRDHVVAKVRELLGSGAPTNRDDTTGLAAAPASRAMAETRAVLIKELARKNRELEAFSYSVSHDLRAPLRGIDGFSHALLEEYADCLDARGRDYLQRVRNGAQHMGRVIDDMLRLLYVSRAELKIERLNVSSIARAVAADLARGSPERRVDLDVQEAISAMGDPYLLRLVFENLLGNAWKFSSKVSRPQIQVGALVRGAEHHFFVRDNGAGFDMTYAGKLFRPFQRLHSADDFPGTGIGLAMVDKVIERSGGRVWAESTVNQGATFYFALPTPKGTMDT
jgi:signal transduction histidine kinase